MHLMRCLAEFKTICIQYAEIRALLQKDYSFKTFLYNQSRISIKFSAFNRIMVKHYIRQTLIRLLNLPIYLPFKAPSYDYVCPSAET